MLVLFLHWKLCKEGYQCTGIGEDGGGSTGSKLLPSAWNSTQEVYTLNYKNDKGQSFLLKVVKIGDSVSINILKQPEEKIAEVTLEIKTYISDYLTDYNKVFASKDDLNKHVEKLLDNFRKNRRLVPPSQRRISTL